MLKPYLDTIPTSRLYVVDRDSSSADILRRCLRASGTSVHAFRSVTEFIQSYAADAPSCLVIGIEPPGDAEFAVIETLTARRDPISTIALGAKATIPFVVRALKAGVWSFLEKPTSLGDLATSVTAALEQARHDFATLRHWTKFERRLAELTDRQREILHHIVLGKANKVIAYDLGISERTVEVHRQRLLRRMCVTSAVELARLTGEFRAAQLSLPRVGNGVSPLPTRVAAVPTSMNGLHDGHREIA